MTQALEERKCTLESTVQAHAVFPCLRDLGQVPVPLSILIYKIGLRYFPCNGVARIK